MRPDPYATTSVCPWSGARESTILDKPLSWHVRFGRFSTSADRVQRGTCVSCGVSVDGPIADIAGPLTWGHD